MKIDDCQMMESQNVMEGDEFLNLCDNVSNNSMTVNVNQGKLPMPMPELLEEDSFDCISQSNKRYRNQGQVQRSKRNTKMNKCCNHNNNGKDDDHNNNVVDAMLHNQGLNTEYDLNSLHELTQVSVSLGSLNSNRKTRASRGSATDPQSLYARKRRERINERLKTLQNLVPNGTKVDISTMLEEAVQYVKFLQLQIKMLSSDELWMYAPIAYNGMGLGLVDLKIPTPNPQC